MMEIFIKILIIITILMIILLIIGIFIGILLPPSDGKYSAANNTIKALTLATQLYYKDNNHYPSESEWKDVILQYIADIDVIPADPWGYSYIYKIPGPDNLPFEIYCLGADGIKGGKGKNKDIYSWEIKGSYNIDTVR